MGLSCLVLTACEQTVIRSPYMADQCVSGALQQMLHCRCSRELYMHCKAGRVPALSHQGLPTGRAHLFPAHTSVTGSVTLGRATSSSIVRVMGESTRPLMVRRWLDQLILGTAPWLRT